MNNGRHYPWVSGPGRKMEGADGVVNFETSDGLYGKVYFCETDSGFVIRPTGQLYRAIIAFRLYCGPITYVADDRLDFIDHEEYDGSRREDRWCNSDDGNV